MLMMSIVAVWLVVMVASLAVWSGIHDRSRGVEGLDDALHPDAPEGCTLREAA
jgi:hypothetical protein